MVTTLSFALLFFVPLLSGYRLENEDVLPPVFEMDQNGEVQQVFAGTEQVEKRQSSCQGEANATPDKGNRWIELLVFADDSTFDGHSAMLGIKDPAKVTKHIQLYYSQLIREVDYRFRRSFENETIQPRVVLKAVIVGSANDQRWWFPFNGDVYSKDTALTRFAEALSTMKNLPTYDFAIAYSGRTVDTNDRQTAHTSPHVNFFRNGMCTPAKSVAFCQDFRGFEGIRGTGRILGYSLGSSFDGDELNADAAKCKSSPSYVMASSYEETTNTYLYSTCSRVQIAKALETPERSCLKNPATAIKFATVSALPGELYSYGDICKQGYGYLADPYYYQTAALPQHRDCRTIQCSIGNTTKYIPNPMSILASCGESMLCIEGKCVMDNRAPRGSCFMGDTAYYLSEASYTGWASCDEAGKMLMKKNNFKQVSDVCYLDRMYRTTCCRTCGYPGGVDPSIKEGLINSN